MLEAEAIAPLAVIGSPHFSPDHWRIIRPYTRLRQVGVNAQYIHGSDQSAPVSPDNTILVLPHMTGASEADLSAWLAERRPMVRRIVYETDDDVFTEGRLQHLIDADFLQGRTPAQIRAEQDIASWLINHVDAVTVSTETLAQLVRSKTHRPVYVVPNALDVRWFRAHMYYKPPWKDVLTIGYAGGRRSERDLVNMARAWGKIAKRYPKVRFVVAAPYKFQIIWRYVPEVRMIEVPWLRLEEYPLAYQVDIGCASVRDTPFNRCRSPIKAWEYATAGAAVVATPAVYADTIRDYDGGILADTTEQWDEALSRLIESKALRTMYSSNMRIAVERNHNLDTQVQRWTDTYWSIARGASREEEGQEAQGLVTA